MIFLAIYFSSYTNVLSTGDPIAWAWDLTTAKRELRILEQAKRAASIELRKETANNPRHDALRYYISYIDLRIQRLCGDIISRTGYQAVAGLKCPPPSGLLPGWQVPSAKTSEERIRELDRRLLEELGKFDDILAREQGKITYSRQLPPPADSGENMPYNQDGIHAKGQEGDEAGNPQKHAQIGQEAKDSNEIKGEKATSWENEERQDQEQPGLKGKRRGVKTQAGPAISKDDDIVARQIREAAEREQDPELRKKLWEEYRKYKEGVR